MHFMALMKTDLTNMKTLRLAADGCGGEDKKSAAIGKCCVWLMFAPKNTEMVALVFHIIGLSSTLPDGVLGNNEKGVSV